MEIERFNFLGLSFHNLTQAQAIEQLEYFISRKAPHMIFSPTAELIVRAKKDSQLREIYNHSDLLTVDGFVVYYTARLFSKPVREPVSTVRLMFGLLGVAQKKGYRVYLLGAKEEVVNKAAENIKSKYPGINIVGWHNGYFDFDKDEKILKDIRDSAADVLFVAMSSPLKEDFIFRNLKKMNVPVCMGVGGSFDIIAGKTRLAPLWISRMGLEWFYRLIQEPGRLFKRYLVTNSAFLWLVLKNLLKKEK